MARKTPSRMELRKQAEAAAAAGDDGTKKKKKKAPAARKTTRRTKEKAPQRKKLVWVILNGSMKEEGRFAYADRAAAEEKIELLRSKSKKLYFIQPTKEVISESGTAAAAAAATTEEAE